MENVILLFALQLGRKYIYICCKNCTTHIQPKAMCTFLETSTFDLSFSFLLIPFFFSFLFFAHYPFQHRFIRLRCFSKCMLLGHLKKTRLLKLEGSGGKIFRTIFRCENGQRQLLVANFSTKKSATRWITLILLFCLFILWRRYNPLV